MKLTVVIPARNEERWLAAQLQALAEQECEHDCEVVVVDNGSTDGTAAIVTRFKSKDQRFQLLDASERPDKSYAMNLAVAATEGDLIAFCDADDIVGDGWLNAISRGLESNLVVTGPNELHRLNPPWLARSRGMSAHDPVGSFAGLFPTIRGNNFAITRSAWATLGGMNAGYHPCEDLEFSLRCWLNGFTIIGIPDAGVHYRYRDSGTVLWRQGFGYGSHRPAIARLLRDAGKPTPPKFAGWKSWLLLAARLPSLVTQEGRSTWLWVAGNRVGQVVGSFRYRIVML